VSSKLCQLCNYSEAYCECDSTYTILSKPKCPKCANDRAIYCADCGSDSLACDCDNDIGDWYCMNCEEEFMWDVYFDTVYYDEEQPDPYTQDNDGKWWWANGKEVKCDCHVPRVLQCDLCQVSRPTASSHWNPWVEITVNEPKSYGWSTWNGWQDAIKKCNHCMEPVLLKTTTLYASSLNDTRSDKIPDWGLYADWAWQPVWRNEHIAWKDYGLPTDYDVAFEQIVYAYELAKSGKTVEIGCIGGHGRTGTILSCMGVLDGFTAAEAIMRVESFYCKEVVETFEQEWFVKWFEAKARGLEAPVKPAPKYATTTTTVTTESATCTVTSHFNLLKANVFSCKVHDCKTFNRDLNWYNQSLPKKNRPTIGTMKDGFVYTANGWQATFSSQLESATKSKKKSKNRR
jgi:hypothetical protein